MSQEWGKDEWLRLDEQGMPEIYIDVKRILLGKLQFKCTACHMWQAKQLLTILISSVGVCLLIEHTRI